MDAASGSRSSIRLVVCFLLLLGAFFSTSTLANDDIAHGSGSEIPCMYDDPCMCNPSLPECQPPPPPPPPPGGRNCYTTQLGYRFGIQGRPSSSFTTQYGVRGWSYPRRVSITQGGGHNESVYLFHDANDFVELTWIWDAGVPMNLTVARLYEGRDFAQTFIRTISEGPHAFWISRWNSDKKMHFKFDSEWISKVLTPPWATGMPRASMEIINQCDTGTSHWWDLHRRGPADGDWILWTGSDWACDTATYYGYDKRSNSEFTTSYRSGEPDRGVRECLATAH
jgi:hypothetical protein